MHTNALVCVYVYIYNYIYTIKYSCTRINNDKYNFPMSWEVRRFGCWHHVQTNATKIRAEGCCGNLKSKLPLAGTAETGPPNTKVTYCSCTITDCRL